MNASKTQAGGDAYGEPVGTGSSLAAPATSQPAFLWWRDNDFRWDIELRSEVILKLEEYARRICVLAGFLNEEGGVFEFHVWDCIPLGVRSVPEITTSAIRLLHDSSLEMGFSILGFVLPEPASAADITSRAAACAEVLPAAALVFSGGQNQLVNVCAWVKSVGTAEPLTLQFRPSLPALAREGYLPFQPLHIGVNRQIDDSQDNGREQPAAESGRKAPEQSAEIPVPVVPAATPGATVVRLEVPSWVWISGLLCFAGVLGTGAWYLHQQTLSAPPAAIVASAPKELRLNLDVRRTAGGLEVEWDRTIASTMNSESGTLEIVDGRRRIQVPLNRAQLMSGKLVYVPQTTNIEMSLTVPTARGVMQEATRLIDGNALSPVPSGVPAPSPAPNRAAAPGKPTGVSSSGAQPANESGTPPAVSLPSATQPAAEPARTTPVFRLPGTKEPAAKESATAAEKTRDRLQPDSGLHLEAPPQVAVRSSEVSVDSLPFVNSQMTIPPATSQFPARPAAPSASHVPVIVPVGVERQVMPVMSTQLRQLLPAKPVFVQVKVKINEFGHVTDVEAENATGVAAHLGRLAAETARRWKFRPATSDGKPVPSEHVLRFNFSRSGQPGSR